MLPVLPKKIRLGGQKRVGRDTGNKHFLGLKCKGQSSTQWSLLTGLDKQVRGVWFNVWEASTVTQWSAISTTCIYSTVAWVPVCRFFLCIMKTRTSIAKNINSTAVLYSTVFSVFAKLFCNLWNCKAESYGKIKISVFDYIRQVRVCIYLKCIYIYRKTIENLWKNKLRNYRPYGVNTKE
jgi:hypothetical protein